MVGKKVLNLTEDNGNFDRKRGRDDPGETASLSAEGVFVKRSKFSDGPAIDSSVSSQDASAAAMAQSSVPEVNPLTMKKYSDRYYDILERRKKLPAWEAKKNFIKLVKRSGVSL